MQTCNVHLGGTCGSINTCSWEMFHKYKNLGFFVFSGDGPVYPDSREDEFYIRVVDLTNPQRTSSKGNTVYRVIVHLDLYKTNKRIGNIYEVGYMRINRAFQGFDLAPRVYCEIIKSRGITIQSGETQSPGGRSIWVRLNKMLGVVVIGAVGTRQSSLELVDSADGVELSSPNHSIYGTDGYKLYAVPAK